MWQKSSIGLNDTNIIISSIQVVHPEDIFLQGFSEVFYVA